MEDFTLNLPQALDQVIQSVPLFGTELILSITFLLSIIAALTLDKLWKQSSFAITLAGLVTAALSLAPQIDNIGNGFFGMLIIDNFSVYVRYIILTTLFLSTLFIQQYFRDKEERANSGDIYSIILAAGLGIHLMTITSNWLLAFIAIETVSISSYVLVGYFSENKKQSEATLKYVLFGSASAAMMLYGISLLYGFTGNLDFASSQHLQGLMTAPKVMTSVALLFVFAGIGFKLGFVPFHLWTPDVYEGAPTPVTAFLSTVPKIGAVILLSRIVQAWQDSLIYFSEITILFIVIVASVTMLAGNLIALRQMNAKRLMAYSSIGHTGFILMAILVTAHSNQEILLFYLSVYSLMNLAAFAFIDSIEKSTGIIDINHYAGMGRKHPIVFTCFTFIGISLIGLPPTAGFTGKLLVFTSVFDQYQDSGSSSFLVLLIIGALTSVISLFYYFKIPLFAFLRKSEQSFDEKKTIDISIVGVVGIVLTVLALLFGLFPNILLDLFN